MSLRDLLWTVRDVFARPASEPRSAKDEERWQREFDEYRDPIGRGLPLESCAFSRGDSEARARQSVSAGQPMLKLIARVEGALDETDIEYEPAMSHFDE